MSARANGYNYTSVLFHWVTALWVVAMLILGIVFTRLGFRDPLYEPLSMAHLILGLFGAVFFPIRVVRRLKNGFKQHLAHNAAERFLSRAVQYVFMILLIIVPITGLFIVFGEGGWLLPGGVETPALGFLSGVVDLGYDTHHILTKVLFGAMVLHILGAVKHAVIDRDDTLMGILKPAKGGK